MRRCPALLISAPASGQGKTTVTAALAAYHRKKGRRVRVFKTGPDFIDPTILEIASGHPVYQLDLWMGGETVYQTGHLTASYIHFYFPSDPQAAARLFLP